jgi:small subunit ribosomal protein S17
MNKRRRLTGVVTSDKMDKTVIVVVGRTYRHKLYKKVVHTKKKLMAHDELDCQIGDQVRIVESRPFSRRKRWVVEEILTRDITAGEPEFETGIDLEVAE